MSPAAFEKQAGALFREYFENDDLEEVAYSLADFNIKNTKHEVNVCRVSTCRDLGLSKAPSSIVY